MKKSLNTVLLIFLALASNASKNLPAYLSDPNVTYKDMEKRLMESFRLIPGGTSIIYGSGTNWDDQMLSLTDYYLQETEVSNRWYKIFLMDIAKNDPEKVWQLLPDTSSWMNDFKYSFNEPMKLFYFAHRAYDDYPVVGVNYSQAQAFAEWVNDKLNHYYKHSTGKNSPIQVHLPTEVEWQYAAAGGLEKNLYGYALSDEHFAPNGVFHLYNSKTKTFRANYKTDEGFFVGDGAFHTAKVGSYEANPYGLRDMIGNVSEWTSSIYKEEAKENTQSDRYIVKGGSWYDDYTLQRINRVLPVQQDSSHCYIGFRLAAYVKK